jgi:AcrR family transcriptional regulator
MTTATRATRPPRRTQAQRRAETRAALLDATITCLVEHGYANTTTGRIADMAGVSRGAQFPYFPSRAALVGAAVAHLAERRTEAVLARFAERPISIEAWLDAMWEEHQGEVFDATLELWVASRTDAELRERLVRIERDVAAAVARGAQAALGAQARRDGFTGDLMFALATIRGVALLRISSGGNGRAVARSWRQARERLLRLLG